MKTTEEKIAEAFANECAQTSHEHAFARGYYAALRNQQPSDPKHLPPRDCLVLYQDDGDRGLGTAPHWIHVNFESADGEYDEEGCARGHDDRWRIVYSDEVLDVKYVITWRELPEVE